MKSTGIVRKIDQLGRITLPKSLRSVLNLSIGDPMEIFVEGDQIITKKYNVQKACIITGEILDDNIEYAQGIFLSPEGAKILLQKLQKKQN
ncbi:AbrB/MazE/SpoVT family DNA-binding domain-containing protein [Planococcus sp. SE5232]|uniref:AbrB/MazE/SpoVT family DNA-binding domain-containing protein n=1 Tax=unclassified Planococcus (in: firmicutes) TaxID=2662419 RepID=UPI003D6B5754